MPVIKLIWREGICKISSDIPVFMKFRFLFMCFAVAVISIGANAQKTSRDIAISRVKAVFDATAKGDVDRLKGLLTSELYQKTYPYSDSYVREMLLNVPADNRERLLCQIQDQCEISTIMNRAGDVMTVILTDKLTKKDLKIQLLDEYGDGNWRICNYWY